MSRNDEQDIAELLTRSGVRVEPPTDMRDRVYQNTLAAFEALPPGQAADSAEPAKVVALRQSARKPAARWYAVAAGLTLVLAAGAVLQQVLQDKNPAASIAYASGGYSIAPHGDGSDELSVNTTLSTAEHGRLLITLDEHTSVRLDEKTKATLQSGQRVFLHSGRLYVDSSGGDNEVQVVTSDVAISKVGTQFSVSLDDQGLTVAVREGQVVVASPTGRESATASSGVGDVIRIDGQGQAQREVVATTDIQYWRWTQLSRPAFDLQTGSLYQYLQWVARERGQHFVTNNDVVSQLLKRERIDFMRTADASDEDLESVLSLTYFNRMTAPEHELRIGQR